MLPLLVAAVYDRRERKIATLPAITEVVNELESSVFPSLHHRKEGN